MEARSKLVTFPSDIKLWGKMIGPCVMVDGGRCAVKLPLIPDTPAHVSYCMMSVSAGRQY